MLIPCGNLAGTGKPAAKLLRFSAEMLAKIRRSDRLPQDLGAAATLLANHVHGHQAGFPV